MAAEHKITINNLYIKIAELVVFTRKWKVEIGLPPFGGPGSKLVHRRSRGDGGVSERP